MVEAGWRKRSFTIPSNARKAAEILCERFNHDGLRVINKHLRLELLPAPDPEPVLKSKRRELGKVYYTVVDWEEVTKHTKLSTAFRMLDKLLIEKKKQGVVVEKGSFFVREDWGRCYF
jgi:hypothetical protein